MTTINKTNLISNIDTLIASLNLSTDSNEKLSLIYKTAINVGETPDTIIAELESRIEATSSLSSIEQLLLYSIVTSFLTEDRSMVVADLTALNALTNISVGSVYYVESEGLPYIRKTNGTWIRIDPSKQNTLLSNAWSVGSNLSGKLGDNTTVSKSSPVSVVGDFTDWVQINGGDSHVLGLRSNGTAWAWGSGAQGTLGNNSVTNRSSPVSIAGGFTDWIKIDAGAQISGGVRANGTLWTWGANFGTLGDGTTVSKSSPVSVIGGFVDWVDLSVGNGHVLGLRTNGTAWAWGANYYGKLGNGNTTNTSSPVSVVGGFTDWVQVSAGGVHSAGIRTNGTAWAWGDNFWGVLGDGTEINKSSPVSVVGGFTDWIQLSAGYQFVSGLRANGTIWSWGRNSTGQLGDGSTVSRLSPVSAVGGFTDWVQISAGRGHTIGLRANGTAWAWGYNGKGGLGNNTITNTSSPVSFIGGFTDWVQVSAMDSANIALRGSNSVTG